MVNNTIQITIFIVNFNSADFIKLTLYALKSLTYYPYKVHILDNGSKPQDYAKLQKICGNAENVILERHETDLRGSIAHGTGLNYLTQQIDTSYFSILDADATWLMKHWDKILIRQLNDKIKVIGTQAWGSKKFQDFPLMFCILFETQTFLKLEIDFCPKNATIGLDTGYELREKYLQAGLQGKNIEIKNTRTYKQGPFSNCICAEFYLDGDYAQIFASHFGRGSSKGKGRYNPSLWYYKIPGLSIFAKYYATIIEKQKWLAICRQIIKNQE